MQNTTRGPCACFALLWATVPLCVLADTTDSAGGPPIAVSQPIAASSIAEGSECPVWR